MQCLNVKSLKFRDLIIFGLFYTHSSFSADVVGAGIDGKIDSVQEIGLVYQLAMAKYLIFGEVLNRCYESHPLVAERARVSWAERNVDYLITIRFIIDSIFQDKSERLTVERNVEKSSMHTYNQYFESGFKSLNDCEFHITLMEKGELDIAQPEKFYEFLEPYREDAIDAVTKAYESEDLE